MDDASTRRPSRASADLLVRGGTVVSSTESRVADVLIVDGAVAAVGPSVDADAVPDGTLEIDATGMLVMPGGIDTHTHLAHPIDRLGITTADDFHTGTIAAACGGVTTIIDFALQRRGESLATARDRRVDEIEPDAVIDYGCHIIVTDVTDAAVSEIPAMIASGFPSFKVYMTYGDKKVDDEGLLRLLEACGQAGGLVYAHCENDCAVTHLIERHLARGETGPAFHATSRPPGVEAEATNRAILLAEVANAPLCIAHVTSAGAAAHVAHARNRDLAVVAETCPQYLVLDASVYDPDLGFEVAKYVCSPPMRTPEHGAALWEALAAGEIQQVSSDHAPFRYEGQKTAGREAFTKIPNGLPGIETRLPLLYTAGVNEGRISPERFVELVATGPARIFGLDNKGRLEPGADGDVIVIDPEREVTVTAERMHSDVDYSPFEGTRLKGFPVWTVSRGEVVAVDGEPARLDLRGRGARAGRIPIRPDALP